MDSKYSNLNKNGKGSSQFVSFSLKRKLSSNQINGPLVKRPHLNNNNNNSSNNNKANGSVSSPNTASNKMTPNVNKNGIQNAQEKILQQQKQLPVFAVKAAYVYITSPQFNKLILFLMFS